MPRTMWPPAASWCVLCLGIAHGFFNRSWHASNPAMVPCLPVSANVDTHSNARCAVPSLFIWINVTSCYTHVHHAGLCNVRCTLACTVVRLNLSLDQFCSYLQEAQRYGLSVFRVFATGGEFSGFVLQPGPGNNLLCNERGTCDLAGSRAAYRCRQTIDLSAGRYNETVFKAIDYMLAQAGNYGLKV